jgi:signal transduction histidine kinase
MVLSTRRAATLARQQVEFVAGVSHELRTPLSVICSAAENLSDGVVVERAQVRRYGALIASEGRRLAEMVEQVMAFAGLHAGRELSERQTVKVSELVDAALGACAPVIGQRAVKVERVIADDLPGVSVSVRAMQRSLHNLLDNAIKYGGEAPWVRVSARREPGTGGVAITIEDRGVGIPAEEQRHIFEPFFRGREVANSSIHGSGLGLSLVKRIVEAHGGRISVSSAAGRGSRFTVHLPAARVAGAGAAAHGIEEPAG